ncbi:sugar O-acetyltransferase [Vibrio panuliri]|uniref:Acetyltransferase n=1 Tax=Vibrio panuliri TaxID=1381081 RepID=A0ABX3FLR1_9VIBR|nr:sugar O-acetyltransferase [Vibrio panuliri]KAB1454672.1 sugar O-acetyltransferase [Vibrio panuliri]OLQ94134.1 galactoside O-acetyltransferase [Vibrio panuliri]
MDTREKMHSGGVYHCNDVSLIAEQRECLEVLYDFNHSRPSQVAQKEQLLHRLLGGVGKECYIEPPLHANWGRNTYVGNSFYANFNLTLVDDTVISIGDHVMIGPNVTLTTAGHPVDPDRRRNVAQFNLPITIEDNVWIGANVVVLPGVSIGENSVIGAGSIVTKDVPSNVVAVGNPCRVLREISERDKVFYHQQRRFDEGLS